MWRMEAPTNILRKICSQCRLPTMSVSCPSLAGRVVAGVDSVASPVAGSCGCSRSAGPGLCWCGWLGWVDILAPGLASYRALPASQGEAGADSARAEGGKYTKYLQSSP